MGEKENSVRVILWEVATIITILFLERAMSDFFIRPVSSGYMIRQERKTSRDETDSLRVLMGVWRVQSLLNASIAFKS